MLSIKNKKWCQLVIFLFVFYGISNGRLLAKEQQASFKLAIVQPIYKSISVKQAPDKHAKTLGQIEQDILIHCVPDMMSDWWWVSQGGIIYSEKEKNPSFQGKGYINKQEINLIDDWSHTAQHQYICNILNQYQAILEKYLLSQNRLGSIADKDMSKIQDTYHELQYIPILPYVENLVINYNDQILLNKWITILVAIEGSADERPAYSLGRIYDQKPALIEKLILEQPIKKRQILIDLLCFYFISSESKPNTELLNYTYYQYYSEKLQALLNSSSK